MGGQLSSRPHGRNHHLVSVGHPASLLGRTPGATHALLDLHVHRADVACLVLSNPQLPVFGWVHFLKQLVHRLDCLQETEKRGHSQRWQLDHAAHAFVPVRAAFVWGLRCAAGCENREPGPLSPTLLLTGCALPSRPQGWMKGQGGLNAARCVISSSICSRIYHH